MERGKMMRGIAGVLLLGLCGGIVSVQAAWVAGTRGYVNYKLFLPDTVAHAGKLPIVLYLHPNGWQGAKWDALNNVDKDTLPSVLSRADSQAHHPCYVLAPECPSTIPGTPSNSWACWLDFGPQTQQLTGMAPNLGWGPVTYSINDSYSGNPIYTPQLQSVIALLDSCAKNFPRVDTNRIHIAGGSMGGYATWFLICKFPTKFASATPLSGAGDTSCARYLTKLPISMFWGDADNICPPAGNSTMFNALVKAGADTVNILHRKVFAGSGHVWDQVWCYDQPTYYQRSLIPWMFAQSRSPTSANRAIRQASAALEFGSIVLHGRTLTAESQKAACLTAFLPSGKIVATRTVSPEKKTSFALPAACSGVIYLRLSNGTSQMVKSVLPSN